MYCLLARQSQQLISKIEFEMSAVFQLVQAW